MQLIVSQIKHTIIDSSQHQLQSWFMQFYVFHHTDYAVISTCAVPDMLGSPIRSMPSLSSCTSIRPSLFLSRRSKSSTNLFSSALGGLEGDTSFSDFPIRYVRTSAWCNHKLRRSHSHRSQTGSGDEITGPQICNCPELSPA